MKAAWATLNIAALYQKLEADEGGFAELGPDYRPATAALGPAFNGRDLTHAVGVSNSTTTQHLYSVRADYDLGRMTLTSLTGYGQSPGDFDFTLFPNDRA